MKSQKYFFPYLLNIFSIFRQLVRVASSGRAADQPGFTSLFTSLKPWRTEKSFNW